MKGVSDMSDTRIFDDISEEEISRMKLCFKAVNKKYTAGETINSIENLSVGIVVSGVIEITKFDFDGNRTILECIAENEIFGDLFFSQIHEGDVQIICSADAEVMFIDYDHLTKQCQNACAHHSKLIQNMLFIVSEKSKKLSNRVEVLSQRTLRKKLITYFNMLSKETGKRNIVLPFSLSSLSDYLCVDRSAMLREMKKMREEGLIDSHAKKVNILYDQTMF